MNFGTFDIESEQWVKFRLCGCFDGQTYKHFFHSMDFLDYINKKQYDRFIWYAHNGGKFDFLFFLEDIYRRGWKVKYGAQSQGRLIELTIITNTIQFYFRDSYALLDQSLKDLGDAFNIKHKKKDFKFIEGMKVNPNDKKLQSYLESDCIGLYEIISCFEQTQYIDNDISLTIASQALKVFRKNFLDCDLQKMKLKHDQLVRKYFYAGGRVEVYKGIGRVKHYDVNSLYPSVMLNEMPCGDIIETNTYHKSKIGFYNVVLKNVPEFYISPLLYRQLDKNGSAKNYFLNGKGEYFLSSSTLNYLKEEYGINFSVNYGIYFSKREELFNEYVNTFYKIKSSYSKTNPLYFVAKKMLNCLYGKFGQELWHESIEHYDGTQNEFSTLESSFVNGLVLVKKKNHSQFIMPYIASYITDLARLSHFNIMRENPKSIFYCDTDSLFTSDFKSFEKFVGKELGKVSSEGIFNGVFIAPKTYALQNKKYEVVKFKGFDSDKFTFNKIKNALLKKQKLSFTKTRPLSFKECLTRKKGIILDEGTFLKVVETTKTASLEYDRREIIPDKKFHFNTQPFERKDFK
jgi:hypothetical protein